MLAWLSEVQRMATHICAASRNSWQIKSIFRLWCRSDLVNTSKRYLSYSAKLYQLLVSIEWPRGYEPRALPLRQVAVIYQSLQLYTRAAQLMEYLQTTVTVWLQWMIKKIAYSKLEIQRPRPRQCLNMMNAKNILYDFVSLASMLLARIKRHPCTVARTSSSPGSSGNIGYHSQ